MDHHVFPSNDKLSDTVHLELFGYGGHVVSLQLEV